MNQTEKINPSKKDVDEQEWSNPQNWHWWCFYFSQKDSRTFVPKRYGYGFTVNFARRGTLWFFLLLMLMPLVIIGSVLLSRAF